MKTPHSDLRILSAHRGLHAKFGDNPNIAGIPENSLSSVEAAAQAGLELLEVDVKLTSDRIPICSHDLTWGRETNPAQPGGHVFDPFSSPSPSAQRQANARIDSMTLAVTQAQFNLRDSVSFLPNYGSHFNVPASLQNVIDRVNLDQIAAVIAIDVKDVDTFKEAWKIVRVAKDWKGNPFAGHVAWKVSGFNYTTPAAFKADFPDYAAINFWPNYNTSQVAASVFGSEQAMIDSLNLFWADPSISLIAPEITQKQPGGIFDRMRQMGINTGHTVAEFAAYKDYVYPNDPNQVAQFFWTGGTNGDGAQLGGSCCVNLRHYFFNPRTNEDGTPNPNYDSTRPTDTADDRGDFDFVVNQMRFNVITTDDVIHWDNLLAAGGLRNLSYMRLDGYQGDPQCRANGTYPGCDQNGQTTYTLCSPEGGTCSFTGDRNVAFGANGTYNTRTITNTTACNVGVFNDPTPGVLKSCYISPPIDYYTAYGGTIYCADEGQYCNFKGNGSAVMAANHRFSRTFFKATNGFQCDVSTFSYWGDPAPNIRKACFYTVDQGYVFPHSGPQGYQFCSGEGDTNGCQFKGLGRVAYGASGSFKYGVFDGGVACTNSVFGDPKPGATKDCYYQWVASAGGASGVSVGGSAAPYDTGGGTGSGNSGPSKTFTVRAGATTFTASQPNDSVATYTWTDGGQPSEVLTSATGSVLGAAMQSVAVSNYAGSPTATITVNAGTTFQTIDGFGGAMTDSAAAVMGSSPNRNAIMNILFSPSGGAGLTIVRSPMGSSDLMASPNDIHTYEDAQGSFSVNGYASDRRQIDLLTQAKSIAGNNFKLLGTPWSAPGWLKRGGALLPAQCGTDDNEIKIGSVAQYASYFAKYVSAYSALGLRPWMVSMQNEPENCKTAMPTTLLSPVDEVALAQALKVTLPSDVKVLGWDHNWNDPDYVNTLASQSVRVDGIGYHCYDGTHYSNQTQSVATYFTECSGFTSGTGNVAGNLGWEVANTLIGPLRYGSRGSVYWSLAQDPNGNPHLASGDACQNCRGMITVNSDGSFQPSQDYYFWAQFSKFVPPGSVRIDSNNSGDFSTVAFHNGSTTTLVVLNSTTHADGGSAGSDERDLRRHVVQWDGDTATQKTAWLVGADGYRRWIGDGSTYNCLIYDAGMLGPDLEAGGALDKYINMRDVWAVCGTAVMGTRSELEVGTYLKSAGGARLTLTSSGLKSIDATGTSRWAPSGAGNRLILQEDGNLVLYSGTTASWASNTVGSGAIWLVIRDDGSFALFNKQNQQVWVSPIDASSYRGKMVQWDGDTAAQKTSWMVGYDGNRRIVHDLGTFQCLHDAGAGNSLTVSSNVLDKLPDLTNVWATCGGTQIGANGALEQGGNLTAGNNTLVLQTDGNLVLYHGAQVPLWSSDTSGKGGVELKLQSDGNLVLYNQSGSSIWTTGTDGSNPGWFILGTDATLQLFDASGNRIWSRTSTDVIPAPTAGYNFCATEGGTCNFTGAGRVLFGARGKATYTWKDVTNGTPCTTAAFGTDPNPGLVKTCWYSTPPRPLQ
ncbi:glycerophosphodiester phosphodiesterase family protein [Terriglobus roseus]|nr:glycerophosphodiester phosphodiesterase family protein [Terriglobus roseus]